MMHVAKISQFLKLTPVKKFLRYYHHIRSYITVVIALGFSLTGLSLVTNILVLVGIHYQKPRLLQPWYV